MSQRATASMFAAALLILLIAVSIVFASTTLANADGSQYIVISDQTKNDEVDFKSLTVTCPEGTKALGGGAGIFYSRDEGNYVLPVLISSFMYPDDASWFAEAVQPEVATTDWYLEVQVTCIEVTD